MSSREVVDSSTSAASAFTQGAATALFVSAVPIAVVSLTVGMAVWLANELLTVGSGQ